MVRAFVLGIAVSLVAVSSVAAQDAFRINHRMTLEEARQTWAELYPVYRGAGLVNDSGCRSDFICEIFMDRDEWAKMSREQMQNTVLALGESLSKIQGVRYVMFVAHELSMAVYDHEKGEGAIERKR